MKFKDADLIGIPLRVAVGKNGLAEGKLEVKRRGDKEAVLIPRNVIEQEIQQMVVKELTGVG